MHFRDGIGTYGDIAHLKDLPSLETVMVENARTTDEGLAQLASIAGLKEVALGKTLVTDDAVASFKRERPEVKVRRQPTP